MAALQGAILLIVARRSDQISAELAVHDDEANLDAAETIRAVKHLTADMNQRLATIERAVGTGR